MNFYGIISPLNEILLSIKSTNMYSVIQYNKYVLVGHKNGE